MDSDTKVIAHPTEDLAGALAAAAPRRWRNGATPVLLAVVLVAGGFLGGVAVHRSTGSVAPAVRSPAARDGGQATAGTIQSVGDGTLTVRTADGRTVTVKVGGNAQVRATTTPAELTAGQNITVQGTTEADGTVTATSLTAS
ncbi:DUF5666 domain-containing protein [Actinoplanes sp. NPDC051494]|uniref:DUF5666 domain-containing protein n=1 Tax=Actinoplanes sp. NPDC051494 TaxID=3363907 RepID=UPI0037924759